MTRSGSNPVVGQGGAQEVPRPGKIRWLRRYVASHREALKQLFGLIFRSLFLFFVPLPIGPFKRQLAGYIDKEGTLHFYEQPPFMLTGWLITFGWIVSLGFGFNELATNQGWSVSMPEAALTWPWVIVLLLTLFVLGGDFGRVKLGFLIFASAVILLLLGLLQVSTGRAIYQSLGKTLAALPDHIDWGVPFVVSTVLGVGFVLTAAWQRINDRWLLRIDSNLLEHRNWEEKDASYSKGAKSFVERFRCMVKKWLFFGWGDILINSHDGSRIYQRIGGVFFATKFARIIKERFRDTEVSEGEISDDGGESQNVGVDP